MSFEFACGAIGLAAWIYLIAGRGGFWRANVIDRINTPAKPAAWPSVVAVVPARDEADVIGTSLSSLLSQNYPASLHVVLVDDQSEDGTGQAARFAATAVGREGLLTVVQGQPLPPGWTGKLWAMKQGIDVTASFSPAPRYLLLTDADIAYEPDVLRGLVARAEAENLCLATLMVKLRCESFAERMLIPAFVFFFQMLYPFAWVNKARSTVAAAAGGCMLVRASGLADAGGIETIRSSLIDDCALGRAMKRQGPIWLGLTDSAHSLRPYDKVADVRRMVARSAYDQLNYSPLLLAGTVVGMIVTYLLPPILGLTASGATQAMGFAAWALMTAAFVPIVRFYKLSPLWAAALPIIACFYLLFTIDSAVQHWRGRGGLWKGRVQARRAEAS